MEAKKKGFKQVTEQEFELIEKLREHPHIRERMQKILELANDHNAAQTADQIEELLIEEMRRLGSATMHEWANRAEQKAGQELKRNDPTVLKRKKKH